MPDHAAERLIADRYALVVPIGQGGMGVVWRARDTLLGREVAIKEVRLPATIPDSERSSMRARVLREARAAARLNHPAAVTLYDVINEQGHAFIVMELISAPTLAQVVAEQGPLEVARAARIGAQVAAALAAAHQAGIVHRDVKPANVMVLGDGARLTDFGIARVKGDPKLTSTGLIVGSPAYMAPEQASGAAAGPEADLWSLGATLYFAVEGRPPFERDGQVAVLTAVVNDAPRTPEHAGELGPIIARLLSKDPRYRPTASGLRDQLERLASASAAGGEAPGAAAGVEEDGEAVDADAADDTVAEERAEDTEQLPELDDVAPLAPAPPPGKPFEVTRPGSKRPGHQGPAHVRPDQPARPGRAATGPPGGHPALGSLPGPGTPGPAGPARAEGAEGPVERPGGAGQPPGNGQPVAASRPVEVTRVPAVLAAGRLASAGVAAGRRLTGGRLPLVFALLAVVALLAAIAASGAFRDRRSSGGAASGQSGATATTKPGSHTTQSSPVPSATEAPGSTAPGSQSGVHVPPGWLTLPHPAGAYTLGYPRGWRASARSDSFNTSIVSGPGGRLFKVQSSSSPTDPMQAWTDLERNFSKRSGYQRIRLEPGQYKGLHAAVWEFTQLEGDQRIHKLDITFKSADGRWGYAVLLQAPEGIWSSTAELSGEFEQAFALSG
jgi:eukaryotic-like serine/threonine-protein kinase